MVTGPPEDEQPDFTPVGAILPVEGIGDFQNYFNAGFPLEAQQLPWFYDVTGKKVVNYAYSYGPHAGSMCECPACTMFNDEWQNRAEMSELADKIHRDAIDMVYRYTAGSPSLNLDGTVDINTVVLMLANFAKKHVAEYQRQMVKKIQTMQLEHTQRLHAAQAQAYKAGEERRKRDLERLKAGDADGRLFRENDKETK